MSEEISPPLTIIKIDIFNVGEEFRENMLDKTFQIIEEGYEGTIRIEDSLEVSHDKTRCLYRVEGLEDFLILKSTIVYEQGYELDDVLDRELQFFDSSGPISSSLPTRLSTTFIIFVTMTEDGEQAAFLAEQFSDQLSRSIKGVGIVGGRILSILQSPKDEEELFRKHYFLSSLNSSSGSGEHRIEKVLMGIEQIAVYTAELSELYNRSKNFFSVLEAGETEISERVEGYLWKLIEPEPVGLETLESWLSYIMERESTVSAMTGNMKVNHIEANSIVFKIENIFNKLNERSFKDYPRNSPLEIDTYRSVTREFENYLVRSEALKSRLETVMEEVRTYLSLKQQKIAIEEQKSSKEQLVRLVNLQEIFHKVEIFIVAVYITEMAHIVFEVMLHEIANLLTAFFIPLALVLAIGISRILHREPTSH